MIELVTDHIFWKKSPVDSSQLPALLCDYCEKHVACHMFQSAPLMLPQIVPQPTNPWSVPFTPTTPWISFTTDGSRQKTFTTEPAT